MLFGLRGAKSSLHTGVMRVTLAKEVFERVSIYWIELALVLKSNKRIRLYQWSVVMYLVRF